MFQQEPGISFNETWKNLENGLRNCADTLNLVPRRIISLHALGMVSGGGAPGSPPWRRLCFEVQQEVSCEQICRHPAVRGIQRQVPGGAPVKSSIHLLPTRGLQIRSKLEIWRYSKTCVSDHLSITTGFSRSLTFSNNESPVQSDHLSNATSDHYF